MTSAIYNSWKAIQLGKADVGSYTGGPIDFLSDTIKVALLATTYSNPAATGQYDTHRFYSDVSAHEVSHANYTAGGATIGSKVINLDAAGSNDRGTFDSTADVTWNSVSFTAQYAVLYHEFATGASPIVAVFDFGSGQTVSNGTFTITWNASGIVAIG